MEEVVNDPEPRPIREPDDTAQDHPHDWPDFDYPEPYVPPEDLERRT